MYISNKKIVGLIEEIVFENGKTYLAKIDTGADSSSIDEKVLEKLGGDKKVVSHKIIRSALGKHKRPTMFLEVEFKGQHFRQKFTVSDRSNLKYKVLIGKDILQKGNFVINPNK